MAKKKEFCLSIKNFQGHVLKSHNFSDVSRDYFWGFVDGIETMLEREHVVIRNDKNRNLCDLTIRGNTA